MDDEVIEESMEIDIMVSTITGIDLPCNNTENEEEDSRLDDSLENKKEGENIETQEMVL